jgi:predicted NACHT family NTPase
MDSTLDFTQYLRSLRTSYEQWWDLYTLSNVIEQKKQEPQFNSTLRVDFNLSVKYPVVTTEQELIGSTPVIQALSQFAPKLIGQPGSGKSTALVRFLLEEAEKQLQGAHGKIPVLLELRYYRASLIELIRDFFKRHQLLISLEQLEELLFNQRLLLLFDGVNELPSVQSYSELIAFRKTYLSTSMVFTTRNLEIGGDLGIHKKLEMQPLTEKQMEQFVKAYVSENKDQILRQLKGHLQKFAQIPLLLLMLCVLAQASETLPSNLGSIFRQFTQSYERKFKEDVPVPETSRRWWPVLMQHLAFSMMQGNPTEFRVSIESSEAKIILTNFLQNKMPYPDDFVLNALDDLVKYHLLQIEPNKSIQFRHQLLQEYYAAEWLLQQLRNLRDDDLQAKYLNYLKWTEPVALMMGLIETCEQAVKVVELALEVDLRLGARLAGSVKSEFQNETVSLIANIIDISEDFPVRGCLATGPLYERKIDLLGLTRSNLAIPHLLEILFKIEPLEEDQIPDDLE